MSSNIYDNDCSIIKQPVNTDQFRKEIDLLKEEIANLKKSKTDFIIDIVNFDKEDKEIEEKNRELLLYLKSLIKTEDFKDNSEIEIKYETNIKIYENIRDTLAIPHCKGTICSCPFRSALVDYLKRRNLNFMFPRVEYNPNHSSFKANYNPKFFLVKYNIHFRNYNYINKEGYNLII
jgi:hypothetical protein